MCGLGRFSFSTIYQNTNGVKKTTLFKKTITVLVFLVITTLVSLIASAIVARRIGVEPVGMLAIGAMLVEFIAIFENWTTPAHIREIAGKDEFRKNMTTHILLKFTFASCGTLVMFAFSGYLSEIFQCDIRIIQAYAFIPLFNSLSSAIHNTFEAKRLMLFRGMIDLGNVSAYFIFAVLFVYSGFVAAIARVGAVIIGLTCGLVLLTSKVSKFGSFDRGIASSYISFGYKTILSGVFSKLIFWADTAMITFFLGAYSTGIYRIAYSLAFYQLIALSAITAGFYPELSENFYRKQKEKFKKTYKDGIMLVVFFILPLTILFCLFPKQIILTLYGDSFLDSAVALSLLALSMFICCLSNISALALLSAGYAKTLMKIDGLGALLNICANYILIQIYGVIGAIIATFLTFIFLMIVYTTLVHKNLNSATWIST